tara:strand:+ start:21 stop:272 length:252 start_codon:yes stop_codon:yes gene_type:complete
MKKLIYLFLILPLLFSSCAKEDCNCGVITNDEIIINSDFSTTYTLSIRNDCSNNIETFIFDYDIWLNNQVGDEFCVTNVDEWK